MYLVTGRTIDAFAAEHADARAPLGRWVAEIEAAAWTCGDDAVRSSSFPTRAIRGPRLIFNIKGNEYRIVCSVRWADPERDLGGIVKIEFIGTHAEYDRIDAATVTYTPPDRRNP